MGLQVKSGTELIRIVSLLLFILRCFTEKLKLKFDMFLL